MNKTIVELRNIEKRYGDFTVFSDVNLEIGTNQTISICGDSGSGKTTLVNVVGLLESPTSGSVIWDGQDVTKNSLKTISRTRSSIFGYIFQHSNMIPELNVIENILLPKMISSYVTDDDKKFSYELLKYVGLSGAEKNDVQTLSGGEKQRVSVIRAIINRPKVIIADEPTGSLDETSGMNVMKVIIDVCERNGSSLILITHNPKFAQMMDKKFVLNKGNLAQIS